jgi:hypothetical protein
MSQQWHYRVIKCSADEKSINRTLAEWSSLGWELVSTSVATHAVATPDVYLFWRAAA